MERLLIVFTDLDGTLFDPVNYSCYPEAKDLISQLHSQGHYVIPVTSKTKTEMDSFSVTIGFSKGYAVENGSCIYLKNGNALKKTVLGSSANSIRKKLKILSEKFPDKIKIVSEMSHEEVAEITGDIDINAMFDREYSELFLLNDRSKIDQLSKAAAEMECSILQGDRFFHCISESAGKDAAVLKIKQEIISAYPDRKVTTLGFGNSENDVPMLRCVDKAFVIFEEGKRKEKLVEFQEACVPTVAGWHKTMKDYLYQNKFFQEVR